MKKTMLCMLLCVALLFSSVCYAEETSTKEEYDFRSTRWGMTETDVRNAEGEPDLELEIDDGIWCIAYVTQLMGNDVILAYRFCDEGLYGAMYIWNEEHSNDSLYISDYNSVKNELTKKYGEPIYDDETWDTPSHEKYYEDSKGDALSYGYLTYKTLYLTDRSLVAMDMSADNYKVSLFITYLSTEILPPETDYSDQL